LQISCSLSSSRTLRVDLCKKRLRKELIADRRTHDDARIGTGMQLALKRISLPILRCKEATLMKSLRQTRVGKVTVRALAVLSAAMLLTLLALFCRSAGAQDAKVDPGKDARAAVIDAPSLTGAPFEGPKVAPATATPRLESVTLAAQPPAPPAPSNAAPLGVPLSGIAAPAHADQPALPGLSEMKSSSVLIPSPAVAPPACSTPVPTSAAAPTVEEMVQKLRELDHQKSQHLQALEELEAQKRLLLVSLQKRLAEQKHLVDEITSGMQVPAHLPRRGMVAEQPPVEQKLDALLLRLEKIEKRLNEMEKPPTLGPVAPNTGAQLKVPMLGPMPIAVDFSFPISKKTGEGEQAFTFWLGLFR
jgi:hypothetical protein